MQHVRKETGPLYATCAQNIYLYMHQPLTLHYGFIPVLVPGCSGFDVVFQNKKTNFTPAPTRDTVILQIP